MLVGSGPWTNCFYKQRLSTYCMSNTDFTCFVSSSPHINPDYKETEPFKNVKFLA